MGLNAGIRPPAVSWVSCLVQQEIVQSFYVHNTGNEHTGYHNQSLFPEWNGGHPYGTKFLNNKVSNSCGHNCIQTHGDTGGRLIRGSECNMGAFEYSFG
jgi:hypothetical protein